jgi:hypothetical protein
VTEIKQGPHFVTRDGKPHVRSAFVLNSEPILRVLYWPIERWRGRLPEDETPLTRINTGIYRPTNYSIFGTMLYTGAVRNGGAEASAVEELPIPPPRTRNIAPRYRDGRWEKFSKARGWIPA